MTDRAVQRDKVLVAFASRWPQPAERDVRRWVKRHPQFTDEIIALANALAGAAGAEDELGTYIRNDPILAERSEVITPMSKEGFEACRKETLDHRKVHGDIPFPGGEGLQRIALWYGTTWPDLAGFIGIDTEIVMRLGHGMMLDPIGARFVDALAFALETDAATVVAGIEWDRVHYDTGPWVSPWRPTDHKTFREAVEASAMSAEDQRFWRDQAPFPRWPRPHRSDPT